MASHSTGLDAGHEAGSIRQVHTAGSDGFEKSGISSSIPQHSSEKDSRNGATHSEISNNDKRADIAVEKLDSSNPSDVEKVHIHQTTLGDFVDEDHEHYDRPAETAKDLVTEVLHVRDDPTLNPWTFRVWFIGKIVCQLLRDGYN
jgi:hypothetical protein